MKLNQILEAEVYYTQKSNKRFRISKNLSFDELKNDQGLLKHSGPHTSIIDVSKVERIAKAPGENKWNAMNSMYGQDDDEIVCAYTGHEWICLAVKVMI